MSRPCDYCGSLGEFITKNGRRVFICSNPGCRYGRSALAVRGFEGFRRSEDSCCYPTLCPKGCGNRVFFIRHNGGSVWVDPPLGWPWPVHGCFDEGRASRSTIAAKSYLGQRNGAGLRFGVVKETWGSRYAGSMVRVEGGTDLYLRLKGKDAGLLAGQLAFYDPAKRTLTDIEHEHHSFAVDTLLQQGQDADTDHGVECPFCKVMVGRDELLHHIVTEHETEALR